MLRTAGLAVLGLCLALPAAAQERERVRVRDGTPYRVWINGEDMTDRVGPLMQRRARLGISVGLVAKETDSLGAFIESVTPGGPAAKAGIRSGDIIVRLDGESVLSSTSRRVSREESAPGVRLIELAARLEPNDTIRVEYLRGDARRTTTLVTGDEPIVAAEGGSFFFRGFPGDSTGERIRIPGLRVEPLDPEWRGRVMEFDRRPGMAFGFGSLSDLELAPINADLGAYFGTSEGVLVIRAPSGGGLNLKSGDVILSIDGRKATNPGSVLRILRSYNDDETFKLEILRQKQRQTVAGKVG